MFAAKSFVNELKNLYPAPSDNKVQFDINDIQSFEKGFGAELPSDYYDFLLAYGLGSFDEYFYVWNPFIDNGIEEFVEFHNRAKENYDYLEKDTDLAECIDCKFSGGELIVLSGNKNLAKFLRTEKIDQDTRSKIIALGDHYPYEFHPQKDGLIYWGRTDDDDFFVRIQDTKISIVMYDGYYYEFDMGITEFILKYLTKTIKLPMMNDETEWNFIPFHVK